jgi:hypothetical protein
VPCPCIGGRSRRFLGAESDFVLRIPDIRITVFFVGGEGLPRGEAKMTTAIQRQVAERTVELMASSAWRMRAWYADRSDEARVYVTGYGCSDASYIWIGADGSRDYSEIPAAARASLTDAIKRLAPKSAVQS